ncbi:MAG: periplasmic heavy metal sensor [Verrucomicrobia bacterium]|nr:periplasmic heavy metal sensor [Verrucomicrobiota bacterium]
MRRGILILLLGVTGAVAAYCGFYRMGTASSREWMRSAQPELAWLKQEFNLSETEFRRISGLHAAYLPQCREMCSRIEQQNGKLRKLLQVEEGMTPEIEAAVGEAARLRGECQRNMLRHFFAVSQTMPPEQGRRYLFWVREKTFLPDHGMGAAPHDPHP